jgi:oligosaccharide repeat unit polymerase
MNELAHFGCGRLAGVYGRSQCDAFFRITGLRIWFPVLPFIGYWVSTFLLYHFGPLVNPPLDGATYIYLAVGFTAFVVAYRVGVGDVGRRAPPDLSRLIRNEVPALRMLQVFVFLGMLGCLGFVVDRIMSGAGSVTKTLHETEFVRGEYAEGTTLLTTFSVIPYSFSLVGLAMYFYACALRCKLSNITHGCVAVLFFLLCFNSFLSVSRGNFFWVLTYFAFHFLFVKGENLRAIALQQKYWWHRAAIASFVCASISYIFFIAAMRNNEQVLEGQTMAWMREVRYGIDELDIDPRNLGALLQLTTYGTHQYGYVDAFLFRAKPLDFQPAFLLGQRLLNQINRIEPDYIPETYEIAQQWIANAGLMESAWPSVFGWLLVMFGYLGAPLFLLFLGWVIGRTVRHFLIHFDAASMIIIFCMSSALNMSFSWIGGDFPHNVGYLIGVVFLLCRQRPGQATAFSPSGRNGGDRSWQWPRRLGVRRAR